jgi:hypothetical protein
MPSHSARSDTCPPAAVPREWSARDEARRTVAGSARLAARARLQVWCLGLALVVLGTLATVSPTFAEQGGQALRSGPPPRANGALAPAEIQRLFDAYVIRQAQQALALTDSQYPEFVSRLRALQELRRQNQRARRQAVAELARLSNRRTEPVGETAIREQMKVLEDLDATAAADLRRAYDEIDQVLDLRQQARFRVFEDQVERRKLELLLQVRRPAAQRSGRQAPPREP